MTNFENPQQDRAVPTPPAGNVDPWMPDAYRIDPNRMQPETAVLESGESFMLDTETEAFSPESVDLPQKAQTGEQFFVFGKINLPDETGELTIPLAAVRVLERNGQSSYFLVGPKTEDNSARSWTQLYKDSPFSFGRAEGQALTKKSFSNSVSRQHANLTLTTEGLVVTDTSSNNTSVEGIRSKQERVRTTGGGAVEAAMPNLISEVPNTPEDLDRIRQTAQEAARAQYDAPIAALDSSMAKLVKDLSVDDIMAIRMYSSYRIGKVKAQIDGDGERSYSEERGMSDQLNHMSPKAKNVADSWSILEQQHDELMRRRNNS